MALQTRFNFGRAGTLFNRKTVKRALTRVHLDPTEHQLQTAKDWAAQVRHPNFHKAKETAVRGEFIQKLLITILGYAPYHPGETFSLATEEALGKGTVDTALGTFSQTERLILAPFELKGPGTADLDAIMPGRNKSPVQQAWEYAIDAPGARWVLVSNCAEIRLYAFGHGRELYETWDLGRLDDPQEHERLWLLIGAQNLLSGRTAALLDESANEQKDITNKLYIDYKKTRDHGVDLNPEPVEITKLSLWLKTAKRGKLLQDLESSVKCGNSLIADRNEHGRAVNWQAEFPEIFARGGFDIVIGNPPYVRQETIKSFKP